jgi:nitrite reductase/ring-hydroxylating ferredoxin subunit
MTRHSIPGFTAPAPGDLVSVHVAGRKFAITVQDGQAYAVDDACTQMQCSLSGGEIEDGAVICPCHFATFDLATGAVRSGPANEALQCYQAQLAGGTLLLEVPE